jgi:hypothetical protein
MFPGFATFEVMDKEPPVWLFFLYTISIGATGMLLARRRPIFCVPFITCVLLGAFALYLELRDSYVGHAIFREGGSAYILAAGLATFVGIGMPLLGAFVGAKDVEGGFRAWRWTLGISGAALLVLSLFASSELVGPAYYEYVSHPGKRTIADGTLPLTWQEIVAQASTICVLIGLVLLSAYLLRAAFQPPQSKRNT